MEKASSGRSKLVQNAIFDAEKSFFEKLPRDHELSASLDTVLVQYVRLLFGQGTMAEQTRVKAADAATAIASRAPKGSRIRAVLAEEVLSAQEQERLFSVQQGLDRTRKALGE